MSHWEERRIMRESVKSAVRALEVLKLFSMERRELSQKEIIARLRYPQSSATFLLKSMVNTGFLSFDRKTRTYLPAPEVYRIGEWLEGFGYQQFFHEGVLAALLNELRLRTGETVSLTSQNDINVQWHRIVGDELPPFRRVTEGASLPLTWSAFGCLLLSRENDAHIERVVRLINAREPDPAKKVNVETTTRWLRKVRANEVFFMANTHLVSAASIVTFLPVRIAGRMVAVGVGGDAEQISRRREHISQCLTDTLANFKPRLIATFGGRDSLTEAA